MKFITIRRGLLLRDRRDVLDRLVQVVRSAQDALQLLVDRLGPGEKIRESSPDLSQPAAEGPDPQGRDLLSLSVTKS